MGCIDFRRIELGQVSSQFKYGHYEGHILNFVLQRDVLNCVISNEAGDPDFFWNLIKFLCAKFIVSEQFTCLFQSKNYQYWNVVHNLDVIKNFNLKYTNDILTAYTMYLVWNTSQGFFCTRLNWFPRSHCSS